MLFRSTLLTAWQDPFAGGTPKAPANVGGCIDFLKGVVPANLFGLEARTVAEGEGFRTTLNFNVLQLLVLSLLLGVAAVRSGEEGRPFLSFAASLLAISRILSGWVGCGLALGGFAILVLAVCRARGEERGRSWPALDAAAFGSRGSHRRWMPRISSEGGTELPT